MKRLFLFLLSLTASSFLAQSPVNYVIMNQFTNDMIYDSLISRVLISIPSKDYVHGNSIGYIDPNAATLAEYYYIGSEPRPLALTDNKKYLFVGLDGSKNIKKFNVSTHATESTFNVGFNTFNGQYFANNLSCQPGTDEVVAVSRAAQGYSRGICIYKNGVRLPDTVSEYPVTVDLVHFYSPKVLFGYNNSNTGFDFSTMFVDSQGVTMVNHIGSLLGGFSNDFSISNGMALSDDGTILDLTGGTPYSLAKISIPTTQGYGPVRSCFDAEANLVCFATRGFWNDSIYIFRYNTTNFLKHDQIVIGGFKEGITKLICWGKSKYMLSTVDGKLLIINNDLTGIKNHTLNDSNVFLNQQTNVVSISGIIGISYISLLDVSGRVILKEELQNNQLDISGVLSGAYLLKLETENGFLIKKIIKN